MKKINSILWILGIAIVAIVGYLLSLVLKKSNPVTSPITGNVSIPPNFADQYNAAVRAGAIPTPIVTNLTTPTTYLMDTNRKYLPINYTVIPADIPLRLVAEIDNTVVNFAVDGNFELIVDAYPVTIYSTNTPNIILDGGAYYIKVLSGTITL